MNTKRRVQKRKQSRKQKRIGGFWPFDKKQEESQQQQNNALQLDQSKIDLYVFMSDKISIQSIPSDYKQIGIIHISDSAGINAIRQFGTNLANTFGSKGFDNTIYDKLRNTVLDKLNQMVAKTNHKVFNVRIDVESSATSSTIFVHLYGDLCEPTSSSRQIRPELEVERPDAQIERQIERPDAQIEIPVAQPPVVNQV